MNHPDTFDVIVIGAGHAGCEAAAAAARVGARTLLLTQAVETIGQMSCNPAIGGIGKSHLVREIDALDGLMGRAADMAGIQLRVLNASKGPAVRATRAQADRALYRQAIRQLLDEQENLRIFQQTVTDLVVEETGGQRRVTGVVTQMGLTFRTAAVVLTTGTFLGGRIHVGLSNHPGGRAGDAPSNALAERLRALPFRVDRLKTGTPPRIDGRTVDFSVMDVQPGDEPTPVLSFLHEASVHGEAKNALRRPRQVPCYITQTNPKTHEIIRAGLDRSPLFTGVIEGIGPRYCPSIEDKVVRFQDRVQHQVFVEPEGLTTSELYPNGISTSLPFDVQMALVRSIRGFESAHITRPGYAIEYDFFDPRDLEYSLETKAVKGLFFAGQINGTTGYEEAGAQGLLAGLNAARQVAGASAWCPRRDEAYLGVLVDDLITLGTNEPYRMFTSRAEFRLRLREDNADQRLTSLGRDMGLVAAERWQAFSGKRSALEALRQALERVNLNPGTPLALALERATGEVVSRESSLGAFIRRPGVTLAALAPVLSETLGMTVPESVATQAEIEIKYEGYIRRQDEEIAKIRRHESIELPGELVYESVPGLSRELAEKLAAARPATLARASRIPGMTPAALSLLLVHARKVRGTMTAPLGQTAD
ncbi:MAG: tRNA uridine-5-carboxymethylaminomethyl(34) synthesis enzyme MnmG [Pseudomonadales bacterium]